MYKIQVRIIDDCRWFDLIKMPNDNRFETFDDANQWLLNNPQYDDREILVARIVAVDDLAA